jgi:hypothetical protein
LLAANLGGTFDERIYGFRTFRGFLEEAERRGLVSLVAAATGPDVDVLVPTQGATFGRPSVGGHRRVKNELWRAFVRWDSGVRRFWNASNGMVVEVPTQQAQDLKLDGLVPIHPIDPDQLKDWMRTYAGKTPISTRSALLAALDDANPFRQFRQLTDNLQRTREWRHFMQSRVEEVITGWVKDNGLSLDIYEAGPVLRPHLSPSGGYLSAHEEAARLAVHEFVNRMTLPELLAIPIPLRLLTR